MKRTLFLLGMFAAFAVIFVGCNCNDDDDNNNNNGGNGAWQIIQTITLTSDTSSVVFDNISDSWEILEIQAWGNVKIEMTDTLEHYEYEPLSLRFNSDSDSNYSIGGNPIPSERTNAMRIGYWCLGLSTLEATIYYIGIDGSDSKFHSCKWHTTTSASTSAGGLELCNGTAFHEDLESSPVWRIEIFADTTDDNYQIAAGSEFILLGLDSD